MVRCWAITLADFSEGVAKLTIKKTSPFIFGFFGLAVKGCDIVLRDRTPVEIAVTLLCPTFDPSKESLYSRTVPANCVADPDILMSNQAAFLVEHPESVWSR